MFKLTRLCLLAVMATLPVTAMADVSYYLGTGVGGARVERDDLDLSFDEYTANASTASDPPYNVRPFRGPIGRTVDGEFIETRVKDPEGTDFAFKVFGGVRVGANLGVEAGYVNLGTATDPFDFIIPRITSTSANPNPPPPTVVQTLRPDQNREIDVETKVDGFQLYAVGYLPLNDTFELFGKIGILTWDQDTLIVDRIGTITPVNQPGIPEIILGDEDPDGVSFESLRVSDSGTDLALGAGVNMKASDRVAVRAELEWFDMDTTSLAWAGTVSLVFGF